MVPGRSGGWPCPDSSRRLISGFVYVGGFSFLHWLVGQRPGDRSVGVIHDESRIEPTWPKLPNGIHSESTHVPGVSAAGASRVPERTRSERLPLNRTSPRGALLVRRRLREGRGSRGASQHFGFS
jgi:hypothetical protein